MTAPDKKKFTTSTQRTTDLSKAVVLKRLREAYLKQKGVSFITKVSPSLFQSKCSDGSKLVIAAFNKPGGKTLAMIDHQDIPDSQDRITIQKQLREFLKNVISGEI